jgi:uncharacterized protein YigE (DUF2233 family)
VQHNQHLPAIRFVSIPAAILLVQITVIACGPRADWFEPTPSKTRVPMRITPRPPTTSPSAQPRDTGWQSFAEGMDLRELPLQVESVTERLSIIRLVPGRVQFRVHLRPAAPQRIRVWAADLDSAIVVNGGYFTPENQPAGLLVSDGHPWGTSYGGFAGMFTVDCAGAVDIRWLAARPYDPGECLAQAIQSFPVLVKPGGVMGFPSPQDGDYPARRTIVARDDDGRILLIVASAGYLTLHEMANWLVHSDLAIDTALNLDGGNSTGMWLRAGGTSLEVDSIVQVPAVISVNPL